MPSAGPKRLHLFGNSALRSGDLRGLQPFGPRLPKPPLAAANPFLTCPVAGEFSRGLRWWLLSGSVACHASFGMRCGPSLRPVSSIHRAWSWPVSSASARWPAPAPGTVERHCFFQRTHFAPFARAAPRLGGRRGAILDVSHSFPTPMRSSSVRSLTVSVAMSSAVACGLEDHPDTTAVETGRICIGLVPR